MKSFIAIIIFGAVGLGIGLFVPDSKTKDTTDTAPTLEVQNQAQPQQVEAQATPLNYAEGDTLWIDVRTDGEFQSGHLDKAVNVPLNVIQEQISQLIPNKTATVALYCRSGNRSGQALKITQGLGYTNAFNAGAYSDLANKN